MSSRLAVLLLLITVVRVLTATIHRTTYKNASITIAESIGYVYLAPIQPVTQRVIVQTKIDISPLTEGIERQKSLAEDLRKLCEFFPEENFFRGGETGRVAHHYDNSLQGVPPHPDGRAQTPPTRHFRLIKLLPTPYDEAVRLCEGQAMKVAEPRSKEERIELQAYMKRLGLNDCLIGVDWDVRTHKYRWASTGIELSTIDSPPERLRDNQPYWNVNFPYQDTFLFAPDGRVHTANPHPHSATSGRPQGHEQEARASVVCQTLSWQENAQDPNLGARQGSPKGIINQTINLCHAVTATLKQGADEMDQYLKELWAVYGMSRAPRPRVTVHARNNGPRRGDQLPRPHDPIQVKRDVRNVSRPKRFIGLTVLGTMLLLSRNAFRIGSFLHGQHAYNKIGRRLEATEAALKAQSIELGMQRIQASEFSTALSVITSQLSDVKIMASRTHSALAITLAIAHVQTLAERCTDKGHLYIHEITTLLNDVASQRIPLILRYTKNRLQEKPEVRGTFVEEDPNESTYLSQFIEDDKITVYGAYLVANEEWDLFRLVSIPGYKGNRMYVPRLDYTYVMVDREQRSFTEVTLTQISSCVNGMCIPYGIQKEVRDDECNLSPLIGAARSTDCPHDVHPAQPFFYDTDDGVIYSVGEPLSVRIECIGGKPGPDDTVTLKGSGIIDIPAGCVVSANHWKVLGRPATLKAADRHPLLTPATREGKEFAFKLPFALPKLKVTQHVFDAVTSYIGSTLWIVLGVVCAIILIAVILLVTGYVKASEAREYVLALKRKLVFVYTKLPEKHTPPASPRPPVSPRPAATMGMPLHVYRPATAGHEATGWKPSAPPIISPKPSAKRLGSPSVTWKNVPSDDDKDRSDDYIDLPSPIRVRPRDSSADSSLGE